MRHLKTFLLNLIASAIVGVGFYALFLWVFRWDRAESFSMAVSVASAGLVGEYLRPYFERLSQRQKERAAERKCRRLEARKAHSSDPSQSSH